MPPVILVFNCNLNLLIMFVFNYDIQNLFFFSNIGQNCRRKSAQDFKRCHAAILFIPHSSSALLPNWPAILFIDYLDFFAAHSQKIGLRVAQIKRQIQ